MLKRLCLGALMAVGCVGMAYAAEGDTPVKSDIQTASDFSIKIKGSEKVESTGDMPFPWSLNSWEATAVMELKLAEEPTTKTKAWKLRCVEGGGGQLYMWQGTNLEGGRKYEVTCTYLVSGGAGGNFAIMGKNVKDQKAELSDTQGKWETAKMTLEMKEAGDIVLRWQAFGNGENTAIWIKDFQVKDVGEAK